MTVQQWKPISQRHEVPATMFFAATVARSAKGGVLGTLDGSLQAMPWRNMPESMMILRPVSHAVADRAADRSRLPLMWNQSVPLRAAARRQQSAY